MKTEIMVLLFLGVASVAAADQKKAPPPPACQDEEAMVADYKKSLSDLMGTVKKESLQDFSRAFHRKSYLTKLTLYTGILDGVVACFDKALQDPATPKSQIETYKQKREANAGLKEKVIHARDSLKATEPDKDAKALIEKLEFPD